MNKILQIAGVVVLACIVAFSFVGCGNKDGKLYTDEEYYAKMIDAFHNLPEGEFLIESSSESLDEGTLTITADVAMYDNENDILYTNSSVINKDGMGEILSTKIVDTWVLDNNNTYAQYTRSYDSSNIFSIPQYDIDTNIDRDYGATFLSTVVGSGNYVFNRFPATFEEYKSFYDYLMGASSSEIDKEITNEFNTKDGVHTLTTTINFVAESTGQTCTVNVVIDFSDDGLQSYNMSIITKANKIITSKSVNELKISSKFDSSKYEEFPADEFAALA